MGAQTQTSADTKSRPVVIRGSGTPIWAGHIEDLDPNLKVRDSWHDQLDGTWGVARKMMLDSYVRQAVEGVTDPIHAADHDFEPGDDTDLAKEVADFCRHVFFERLNWSRILDQVLLYFRDGVSLLEVTDDFRPISASRFPSHPQPSAALVPTGFHHVPAGTIDQWYGREDDPTKLGKIVQWIQGNSQEAPGFRPISADRLLRFTWIQEGANFKGFAPLRAVYGPWFRKVTLVAISMIGHERHHVGVPTALVDESVAAQLSEDEREKLEASLLELRAHEKAFLILSGIKEFEFKNAGAGTDVGADIKEANFEIAHGFAGGWQLLGSGNGNGSYALAGTQQGRTHVVTHRHADFVDDGFNCGQDGWTPVERVVRANFGPNAPIPRKVTRNVPTVDYLKIIESATKLKQAGFMKATEKDENTFRGWMLMSKRRPDDPLLNEPAQQTFGFPTQIGGDTQEGVEEETQE